MHRVKEIHIRRFAHIREGTEGFPKKGQLLSCDVKDKELSGGEGGGRKEHYRKEFVKRLVAFFF